MKTTGMDADDNDEELESSPMVMYKSHAQQTLIPFSVDKIYAFT